MQWPIRGGYVALRIEQIIWFLQDYPNAVKNTQQSLEEIKEITSSLGIVPADRLAVILGLKNVMKLIDLVETPQYKALIE